MSKLIVLVLSALMASVHPQDGPHADLRVEILPDRVVEHVAMNLVFLDEFAPTAREKPDDLHPVELPAVQEALATAMAVHAAVTVDGIPVPPRIEGLRLAAVDSTLLPLFPRSGMRGMRRVEFEAVYPLKQPPNRVTIGWDAFPEDLLSTPEQPRYIVLSAELEGEGRRQGVEFSRDNTRIEWRAPTGAPGDELLAVPTPPTATPAMGMRELSAWAATEAVALALAIWLALRPRRAVRMLALAPLAVCCALPVVIVPRIAPRVPLP
ncbi:MAG: hypothetical protein JNK53_05135, partial [Phycisphaerae bacterium]|nr:hypothetical protein [Phycisphaerae bacterium]